jgi:small subunit ribosomal protein S6
MSTAIQGPGEIRSVGSRLGTQREYETIVILRPETNKGGVLEFVDKAKTIFTTQGSRLQKFDNWGLRTLAYPIARSAKGVYLYLRYLGGSDVVQEFERNLRITENVLRFLTVRVDDDVDPDARPSSVTDAEIDELAEPGEDPIDVERRRQEEAAAAAAVEAAERASSAADEDDDVEEGEEDDEEQDDEDEDEDAED